MVAAIGRIAKRYDLTIGTFGHAGDGNLHPTILTDKRNRAEWERVEKAIDDIFDEALKMGGTLSGEHGTGLPNRATWKRRPAPERSCFHHGSNAPWIPTTSSTPARLSPRKV
jgi:FAD/FMN-containing dehydrogenase